MRARCTKGNPLAKRKRGKKERSGKEETALTALSQQLAVRLQLLVKVERAKEGRRGSARMQE